MDRRTLLTTGGAAVLGVGLAGCRSATRVPQATAPAPAAAREPRRACISAERVIRTTVGLRPHRDGGFVLRADRLNDKTLIHNYGHGGAGMSLAWGCGTLVADLAQPAGAPGARQ